MLRYTGWSKKYELKHGNEARIDILSLNQSVKNTVIGLFKLVISDKWRNLMTPITVLEPRSCIIDKISESDVSVRTHRRVLSRITLRVEYLGLVKM